ncbi:MAG: metal-dependent transcriptional regulator [Flavobacteriales bacterium]|nr:metal-dependent transcriptional regulator [Flavobacteriales bacterium]
MITLSEENYIKAILSINLEKNSIVSTNEIAKILETSAASVTEMIKKLQDRKLVIYEKYKGVKLSKAGRIKAFEILRKHRLWETFLVNKLDFSWSEVHDVAEQLEHIKSEKLTDKLDHFLNYPKFDPHGEPIPTKSGIITSTKRITLSEMKINSEGIIMGVSLDNKEFLDHLTKISISIGTKVEAIDRIIFDQSMKIKINSKIEHISKEIANNILIKLN